ncbi:pseudaminic acid cytidylyltransferase [bacterium]|nr:pseudaminic acid cytidylyltransferase [bacterium]
MKIAIMPARGGSKRIPRKNIKLFSGKPMIAWAIEAAKKSGLFDHIVVSTDDLEIMEISKDWGAETPFTRPENLADDLTPTVPVIAHAIEACQALGWSVDYACCIYPGVPFLQANDMIEAHSLLISSHADFIYPVAEYGHPTQRAMRQLPGGKMEFIDPSSELIRTQDLETTFQDAGQFYWGRAEAWLEHKKMHTDGLGMVIPNWRVVDIDNIEDWKRAELLSEVIKLD